MFAVSVLSAFALAAATLPDCRLNQARWLGSHNSFKPVLPDAYYDMLATRLQRLAEPPARLQLQEKLQTLRYGHASLTSQLNSGLRLLELDFLKDDAGGSFAKPLFGAELKHVLQQQKTAENAAQYLSPKDLPTMDLRPVDLAASLKRPSLKVLHLPDIDFASHCVEARDCIATLARWSKTNPGHWPVLIVINVREQGVGGYLPDATVTKAAKVAPWQAEDYLALEQLWLDGLGRERLLTPDDVRKAPLSLATSVQQHGWPTLKQAAGRFLLLFDGSPAQLALYRSGHPSLQGRLMFGNYAADTAEAAIRVLNDPATQQAEIAVALAQGLLVRTRSDDGNVLQPSRFQAALQSRAQFISSDFYQGAPQGEPALQFRLPDGPFTAALCQTKGTP